MMTAKEMIESVDKGEKYPPAVRVAAQFIRDGGDEKKFSEMFPGDCRSWTAVMILQAIQQLNGKIPYYAKGNHGFKCETPSIDQIPPPDSF